GQVLCQRIEIGPCALAIIGKPSAAAVPVAAAAPVRNLRRDTFFSVVLIVFSPPTLSTGFAGAIPAVSGPSRIWAPPASLPTRAGACAFYNRRSQAPHSGLQDRISAPWNPAPP